MDPSRFFNGDGDLDFLAEDVPDVLKVLNEDIFKGALSVRDVRGLPRVWLTLSSQAAVAI